MDLNQFILLQHRWCTCIGVVKTERRARGSLVNAACPRSENQELIPRSVVLLTTTVFHTNLSDGLVETAVLSPDECHIMRHVFLPLYQAEVELSMPFTVWCFAHRCSLLCPFVGIKESSVLYHQQVLGETRVSC